MKTTSKTPALFLGIDVGKTDLFCYLLTNDSTFQKRFDNTPAGIASLIAWLEKQVAIEGIHTCLEQTGHYGRPVAKALHKAGIGSLYLVNPRQIKAFGNQKLRRNKSDTADARLIAEFVRSEHKELIPWSPQSVDNEQIKELSRYAEALTNDTAELKTRCESVTLPAVLRSLKRRIKAQQNELADIRKRINTLIKANHEIKVQQRLLASIPGIGEITQHILIAELPEIDHFHSARQLAAWAGLTPRHYISGTSGRTRTPITKIGSAALRRALFMPAMTARTNNPLLKTFGDRLRDNGKTPKQIIIAIMRKLLHQIYGILKSGQPYNPQKRGLNTAAAH